MKIAKKAKSALIFSLAALMCLGIVAYASAQVRGLAQYCEMSLSGCPQDYDGRELVVSQNVIAMSAQIRACGFSDTLASDGGGIPSIVFIIDQSASMYGVGYDPEANRYRVTSAILDTLYARVPEAEVGVVLFRNDLVFDVRNDNSTRRRLFDGNLVAHTGTGMSGQSGGDGAYMPFLTLNDASSNIIRDGFFGRDSSHSGGNALTGYDVLKNIMKISDTTVAATFNPNRNVQDLAYRPAFGSSGTNISRAFDAARIILANARAPRENQYIIFISDGEASQPSGSGSTARNQREHYILGLDVPTTFTVYLNPDGEAHPDLERMTTNIRENNQDSSNIWALTSDYNELLTLMMDNIITPMLATSEGEAKSITVSSGGSNYTGQLTDGNFVFTRRLPVDTASVTTVEMEMKFDVEVAIPDSFYVDPATGELMQATRTVRDSLFTYSFAVRRSASASPIPDVVEICGNSPTLDLLYQGVSLVNGEIKGYMDFLTISFDNTGGLLDYSKVEVEVTNAAGTFRDMEKYLLRRNGDIWTYDFRRIVDESAVSENLILQHTAQDSIIVIFRNPDFPLDTLRISVPYVSTTVAFYDRPGDPRQADTLGAAVTVIAGEPLDLYAKFFDPNGVWDQSFENDPSKITWNISGTGATLTGDGVHGVFYSETSGRIHTVTVTYTEGSMVLTTSIEITVDPAPPRYLEVLFDTTNIAGKVDTNRLKAPKQYEFDKDQDKAVFYAVARDRFGNLIPGGAVGSSWSSSDPGVITAQGRGNGASADISRQGTYGEGLRVIVEKDGITAAVDITIVGDSQVAIGPNPFVPHRDSPAERLIALDQQNGTNTYEVYKDIIEGRGPTGGTVSSNKNGGQTGVLIAATAPRSVRIIGNRAQASVVIYDAVGNIVYRSSDLAITADGNTFGLVWDGKNSAGRTVGPGTYLVRMVGTMSNGQRFSTQRRIGVTSEGKTR